MSVMLRNPEILEMLRNGGFDTRPPARIFLPPKFYSSILYDSGHRTPEDVLQNNLELVMGAVYDGNMVDRSPSTASLSKTALTATSSSIFQPRPNTISYSDGSAGNRNKGSGVLEKNTVTNFKSSLAPSHGAVPGGKTSSSSIGTYQTRNGESRLNSPRSQDGPYNLRSALPGEPDIDYPILGRIPETSFKCHQRHDGYYADVEARCQVFRVCANTDDTGNGFAFLCPNGTLFNQKYFVCDWYMNVRCEESENFYSRNKELGKTTTNFGEMMGAVMSMVSFPLMSSLLGVGGGSADREKSIPADGQSVPGNDATRQNFPSAGGAVNWQGKLNQKIQQGKSAAVQSNFNKGNTFGAQPVKTRGHVPVAPETVYVSNLGTLSTDPESGFHPTKSRLLHSSIARDLLPPLRTETEDINSSLSNQFRHNQKQHSQPASPKIQLFMAQLLKTWTDQGYAKMPAQPNKIVPPSSISILPPSGVLPKSPIPTELRRNFGIPNSQLVQLSSAPFNPNPITVQNVYPINKVTVTPQRNLHSAHAAHRIPPVSSGLPQGAQIFTHHPPPISTPLRRPQIPATSILQPAAAQLSHRKDQQLPSQRISVPRLQQTASSSFSTVYSASALPRREVGYDIEIIPAFGYYLNNELERKSFRKSLSSSSAGTTTVISEPRTLGRIFTNPAIYYNGIPSSYDIPKVDIGPY
ncbi:uncharacterized protein LOC129757491 isoform X2 [Uranotaenia lowii]|nr:uncharacterized protein LOC129757491 isoform X2 [Uranotaenia lowii]